MNWTLYKREMKASWKLLAVFTALLTLYVVMIILMYTPEMLNMFRQFSETMPQMMSAFSMDFSSDSLTLLGYMVSGLYGYILILFPMIFSMVRGNGLVARYVDRGSMASLLAAPVKRRTVAVTQMAVLITGIVWMIAYTTALELITVAGYAPGQADTGTLLLLNLGLLSVHLFIGGICFLASCVFNEIAALAGYRRGRAGRDVRVPIALSSGGQDRILQIRHLFFALRSQRHRRGRERRDDRRVDTVCGRRDPLRAGCGAFRPA